jgi:hypothetical protein
MVTVTPFPEGKVGEGLQRYHASRFSQLVKLKWFFGGTSWKMLTNEVFLRSSASIILFYTGTKG